jgi:hypothetical protein
MDIPLRKLYGMRNLPRLRPGTILRRTAFAVIGTPQNPFIQSL